MDNQINETLMSLTNEQIAELRHNSAIPTDSWKVIDSLIFDSAQKILTAGNDLIGLGLTAPLDIGTKVSVVDVSSERDAAITMDLEGSDGWDRSLFKSQSFAIPVIKARTRLGARDIAASQRVGVDLPTQQIRQSINACMNSLEGMIFNGAPDIVAGSNKVLGLKTTTAKKEVTISDWSSATTNVITNFESMLAEMYKNGYVNGSFILYVSPASYAKLTGDYKDQSNQTFIDRITGYPGVAAVRPTTQLSGKSNVLVNMNPETIDLAVARDITAVPLQNDIVRGTEVFVYGVMGVRIKSAYAGEVGVIVGK